MTKKSNITRAATVTPESMMVDLASKAFISATDASGEVNRIIAMTPIDGLKLKLELITEAKDMTTREKLQAIFAAENKYKLDLADNAKICWGINWRKAVIAALGFTSITLLTISPLGKRMRDAVVRMVS